MLAIPMRRICALLALCLISACATIPRYQAASDIHAFLIAIRDGDRAGFDVHVDRPALKAQLRSRLIAEAGRSNSALGAIGALMAGPLVGIGVDALVQPNVFRAVAADYGYRTDQPIPGVIAIGQFVRPLDDGRACVFTRRGGPCVLVFRDEAGTWKLIGFEGKIDFGKGGKLKLSE
jgi:hypothetical protein